MKVLNLNFEWVYHMRDVLTILPQMFLHYHWKLYLAVEVIGLSLSATKVEMFSCGKTLAIIKNQKIF